MSEFRVHAVNRVGRPEFRIYAVGQGGVILQNHNCLPNPAPTASLPLNQMQWGLEQLCLTCALCCNGAIFADVKLQPGENAVTLKSAGLELKRRRLPQPCAALAGKCCRVYAVRPEHCRNFECSLLHGFKAGRISSVAASQVVREARQRLRKVEGLLRKLGDTQQHLAFRARFRSVTRRLQNAPPQRRTARLYGDLTLAMHGLNMLLGEGFYPVSGRVARD